MIANLIQQILCRRKVYRNSRHRTAANSGKRKLGATRKRRENDQPVQVREQKKKSW